MRKKIIIIAALFAVISGCGSKSKSARDYNNNIITEERALEPDVTATEDNVKRYYDAGQFDSIAVAGEKMENIVQKTIDEINTMPVPKAKEADNFKAAMITYFRFIKSMYTNYKEFGRADTEEKRNEVLQEIKKAVGEKQDKLNDMQSAQRKFAEANNFKLEAKTY